MEGFFADPIYGGNRNKVSWRMVGYPGLPATWADKALEYRGKKVTIEPQSIADFSLRSAIHGHQTESKSMPSWSAWAGPAASWRAS